MRENMGINIGGKIKQIRKNKSISQNALAKKAGIAQSTLSYIENGSKHPRFDTLSSICSALEVSVFELLSYGEKESTKRLFEEQAKAASLLCSDGILLCDQKEFQKSVYEKYMQVNTH